MGIATEEKALLDSQAIQLNDTIAKENPAVLDMLSDRGKAIFFPKLGILSQSAEAKGKEINATIGIAKEDDGSPMHLKVLSEQLNLKPAQAFPYAPSPGTPEIRSLWKSKIAEKNPSLNGAIYSNPVVTNALTHSLGIAGFLFAGAEDKIILPNYYWENYDLTFNIAYGSSLETFETFNSQGGFNIAGLEEALSAGPVGKRIVVLNFPNNPTGYTPTNTEMEGIAEALIASAQKGNKVVVIIDDAYFGLVFEEGVYTESIFSKLAGAHENLLAVKVDGPTKEDYVWGFRVGFLTFGIKNASPALYQALEAKAGGAIRGTISNASIISQSVLTQGWASEAYGAQKEEKFETLKNRYTKIKSILTSHPEYAEEFRPLPFNSGYFMCIQLNKGNAEEVRQILLKDFNTGVIAFGDLIRLAFSSTPTQQLEQLFQNVYEASKASH